VKLVRLMKKMWTTWLTSPSIPGITHGYKTRGTFHVDETAPFYSLMADKTLIMKGEMFGSTALLQCWWQWRIETTDNLKVCGTQVFQECWHFSLSIQ
jgi:hypothetical protein